MTIFGPDEENLRKKLLLISEFKWSEREKETLNSWANLIDPRGSSLGQDVVRILRDLKILVPASTENRRGVPRQIWERDDDQLIRFFEKWQLYEIAESLTDPIYDLPGIRRIPEFVRKNRPDLFNWVRR
jgi:hypothetical protein